jgi:ATPase subunit of ABC transporter with duplicated ATPase domains
MNKQHSATYISFSDLTFQFANGTRLFSGLQAALTEGSHGLVGINGSGKTTLLKLISGELAPHGGQMNVRGNIAVLPQQRVYSPELTVAEVLGIRQKLEALAAVETGNYLPKLLETIDQEDWQLRERLKILMDKEGIGHIDPARAMGTLSGGETVRLNLVKLLLASPDIILLDEPTNDLDASGRDLIYDLISGWKKLLLVISHDRHLLGLVGNILELSERGLRMYGGNYGHYLEQRYLEEQAAEQQLSSARQKLKKERSDLQDSLERQSRRMSVGKKHGEKSGLPTVVQGMKKRQAEKTAGRIADVQSSRIASAEEAVREARSNIKKDERINIDIPETKVPRKKQLVVCEDFDLRFARDQEPLYRKPLTFEVTGPERVEVRGANGSGKTTLLKHIYAAGRGKASGMDVQTSGKLQVRISRIGYLDQRTAFLREDETLLANLARFTPHLAEAERRIRLGRWLFAQERSLQKVSGLSGGEKVRAGLACLLYAEEPPQLLILDEPANNLDLESLSELESALNCFQGAILVVSHDREFLKAIGVTNTIELEL